MALAPTSEDVKEPPPVNETTEPSENENANQKSSDSAAAIASDDLEDGEIEDDEDEVAPEAPVQSVVVDPPPPSTPKHEKHKERVDEKERPIADAKHKKKHLTEAEKCVLKLHKMERMEREKREKYRRDQSHPPSSLDVDDYAVSLEKALAKVLRKDKTVSEDEKEEETAKRNRKRKRKDKHKKTKKSRQDSPRNADDENEKPDGDDDGRKSDEESSDTESSSDKSDIRKRHCNRDNKRDNIKNRRDRRDRSRDRNNGGSFKKLRKRNVGICLYYLQGKCADEHCPYSHDCVQPLKLELCKFYLQDCCAKGDKCLYMHSDFPCKYYHTGLPCPFGEECKFAHGGPLPESVKQILFKHIETAPKEILGNFPRLSRENAHLMITQAQKNLELRMGKPKEEVIAKKEEQPLFDFSFNNHNMDNQDSVSDSDGQKSADKKEKRHRPSRWQDPEPEATADAIKGILTGFGLKSAYQDQDMRINSNGDVDMRAMPNLPHQSIHPTDIANPNIFTSKPPPILPSNLQNLQGLQNLNLQLLQPTATSFGLMNSNILTQSNLVSSGQGFATPHDSLKSASSTSVDIEQYKMDASQGSKVKQDDKDTDLRKDSSNQVQPDADNPLMSISQTFDAPDEEENPLQIVMDEEEPPKAEVVAKPDDPMLGLPKTQRDLFQRIQQQQKLNTPQLDARNTEPSEIPDQNIDWYSDDEDDNKLTIEHDDRDDNPEDKSDQKTDSPAEPLEPAAIVEKLGDLSSFDISAQVSKLLSSIQQNSKPSDPRTKPSDPRESRDPRLLRHSSTDDAPKPEPMTIYEQSNEKDVDLRGGDRVGRTDVDLRNLNMPFKNLGNYTPASEIDASINSHPALLWRVYIVDIPKPDYTGLKLSANDAQTSGDPRLKKIFRLSNDDKDSPASPGASPKATTTPAPRIDPRRKKAMEQQAAAQQEKDLQPLTYAQQLSTLQSSPFYQSLTSNQKVMLNQELASRNDQSGMSDPIISAMLSNLGLQQQAQHTPQQTGQAMNILNNLASYTPNPLMSNAPPNMGQGLLGPAPTHLQDFPIGFDPRNGAGLLGSGPNVFAPQDFGGLQQPPSNVNAGFNDDYYDQGGGGNFAPNQRQDNNRFNNGGGQNRDRNNRRGRNNNNNNHRNRNNYFRRQQHHNNNRNRNSPS